MQSDENENGSKTILIPKRFDYAIGSPKRNQSVSLYDKAFQLTGDTLFSRKLEEEELKEEQRRLELQQTDRASSPYVLYSSLYFPIIILAVTKQGFAATFQETVKTSANILFLVWLPVLFFNANWIEIGCFATLLIRPPIYSFLVNEFFSDTWAILKKLLLSELWRRFWEYATTVFFMPDLSPSAVHLELTPDWFQKGWTRVRKVVDKYVQRLVRRSFERSIQESLGIAVDAILESMLKRGHTPSGFDYHEVSTNASSGQSQRM